MSFPCTHCMHDKTGVIDSRYDKNGIRRRRECEVCGARFTTRETVVDGTRITPEGPLLLSLSGLPVDQQRAVRTLVDALSYVEEPLLLVKAGEDMEDA